MPERKKLGDLLKEAGLIDDFQLEAALSHQRNWGGKLGDILAELEFAREEDIARIVAEKLKIPYVNLFEPELSADVLRLLKADTAKKFAVVPVRREAKTLVLAMSDPLDIGIMDNVRFITGCTIKPVLAMTSEIKDAIRKYYDGEPVVRVKRPTRQETVQEEGNMELVREVQEIEPADLSQHAHHHEIPAHVAEHASQKVVLEALIELLVDTDLITREELAKYVEQKRMGI